MMRTYIIFALFLAAGFTVSGQPFQLSPLGYRFDALEPHLDALTMEIHYTRHHQSYVTNLNKAIAGTPGEHKSIVEILLNMNAYPAAVRNNGGGHYNHSLFWEMMSPTPAKKPSAALEKAIIGSFGTIDSLKREINRKAMGQFGSGWAWLIVTPDNRLAVTATPNQDNPLMNVVATRGIPIIGIDVWEHAYYLKFQNKRGDYLGSIWNVIDWNVISARYDAAIASPLLMQLK
jgi:superoxide dismutase, Fe-Mn family